MVLRLRKEEEKDGLKELLTQLTMEMRTKYFQEDENQQNSPQDTQNKVESKLLGKYLIPQTR